MPNASKRGGQLKISAKRWPAAASRDFRPRSNARSPALPPAWRGPPAGLPHAVQGRSGGEALLPLRRSSALKEASRWLDEGFRRIRDFPAATALRQSDPVG